MTQASSAIGRDMFVRTLFVTTLLCLYVLLPAYGQSFDKRECSQYAQNTATVLITTDTETSLGTGSTLSEGDQIALITKDGSCAGMITWQGANTALSVSEYWSDSLSTVPGYNTGDEMRYRVWDASEKNVYEAQVEYMECQLCTTQNTYKNDGIYILSRVETTASSRPPRTVALHPNYPNPVTRQTTISFELPEPTTATLTIYNALGRTVASFGPKKRSAGQHELTWDASNAASGMYVYKLSTDRATETRKLLVVHQ